MTITPLNGVTSAIANPPPAPVREVKPMTTGMQFEAMVLQVFLEKVIPETETVYGSGLSGGMWKSQMAQVIASQIVQAGSLGLANYVDDAT